MLIVYKGNKATGITYSEDKTEYHNYHKQFNEYCVWMPNKKLDYDEYGNCITILSFEELVVAKKHSIANQRYQKQSSNLYIEEFDAIFYGDKEALSDVTREIAAVEDAVLMGYWNPETDIISWKTTTGFVNLSIEQLKRVRLYFSQRTQFLFNTENQILDLINEATTIEELNEIEWGEF